MSSETLHGKRSLPLSLFIVHAFVTQPGGEPPSKCSLTLSLCLCISPSLPCMRLSFSPARSFTPGAGLEHCCSPRSLSLSSSLSLTRVKVPASTAGHLKRPAMFSRSQAGIRSQASKVPGPSEEQIIFKHRKYLGWWHWMHAYTLSKSNLTI